MPTTITAFDQITGIICSTFTVYSAEEIAPNVPQGCDWIEGAHAPGEFYVKAGEARPLPPKPSEGFRFDLASESWVDTRTAADIAEMAKAAFTARRNKALESGTTFSGMHLQTDDITQSRVTGAALAAMLDPAYSVQWKLQDGTFTSLTAPQIIAVAQAIRSHVQACYDREAALIAALDAGQPYDIEAGWPS